MAPQSVEIVRDTARRLRALELGALAKGRDHLARASGILATRYEAIADRISAPEPTIQTQPGMDSHVEAGGHNPPHAGG